MFDADMLCSITNANKSNSCKLSDNLGLTILQLKKQNIN